LAVNSNIRKCNGTFGIDGLPWDNHLKSYIEDGHLLLEKQAAIFCVISPMNIIMKFFQSQLYAL